MNTGNRHNAPYSAADIEKYRKGELSAREMHDLEQAALDDPFLADAMEGLLQHPAPQNDIADLRERLDSKVKEAARRHRLLILQRRLTFAAALALLLGIGYTFFYRHSDHPAPAADPALVGKSPTQPSAATPASQPRTITQPDTDRSIAVAQPRRHHATQPFTKRSVALSSTTPPAPKPDSTTLDLARNNHPPATYKNFYFQKSDSLALLKSLPPLVYNGKVLDYQNRPVAGAFLALKGNNALGTVTDDRGQFELRVHPRDSTRQLTVSMIGYDHASLAVNALSTEDATNNVIHLKPSTADLNEVVVVGYGVHRKGTEATAPSESKEKLDTLWNMAAPVIGRQAYLQYLGIAKKKLGLDSTITGTETVSFIVSRNGSLSAFKIEQSLSPAHDAGVIRLVTDGPAWHLIRGKKVRASVTVNF